MARVMRHSTDFSLEVESDARNERSMALIVVNYSLPSFTPVLWQQVRLRVCADGGANRLFDELPRFLPHEDPSSVRRRHRPDVIVGDLDSIRQGVREFYSRLGTRVIDQSHDQDSTDLQKCVRFIVSSTPNAELAELKLLVVGALGGRFDHVAANVNALYVFSSLRIVLLGDESLLYLLPAGYSHEISVNTAFEGPQCGLIPFGALSESTTTTGLRWNLDKTKMAFGSLISTSNLLLGDFVTVVSDCHLAWTTSLRPSRSESCPPKSAAERT